SIPYWHLLFPRQLVKEFIEKMENIRPLAESKLNRWSLIKFHNLWEKYSNKLKKIKYKESLNIFHLDLIMQYPSCFKSKTNYFDNLIVDGIEVLFKKIN
ncbi:unnamed protein product, partial [marine sediment metagenome]